MAEITNNQWGTVTFQIPDKLEEIRDKINTTAELLVAVLDVALTALEFVKTFLVGYLDPIAALVQAIITEVETLVNDMRQLGIYITGDWKLMEWPFPELKGGFQEYQRRMVSRLTDLTDPSRPDVSANTKVLSMFFYLSADVSEVERLVKFVRMILAFFGQSISSKGSLPVPVPGTVQYGANAVDILHPKSIPEAFSTSDTPPSLAKIRWGLASTSQKSPFNPIPPLPPGGFIVAVSTVQDGLKVMFDSPQSDTSLQPTTSDSTKLVQPRDYGQVRVQDSGTPLILFGGSDMFPSSSLMIGGSSLVNYNGTLKTQGATRVYAQMVVGDDGIIPLDDLEWQDDPNTKLLQRTFYVPQTEKWASWATGEYGFILAADDMPFTCVWEKQSDGTIIPKKDVQGNPILERATTAYVRIAACSKEAFDNQAHYMLQSPDARGGRPFVEASLIGLAATDLGAWSQPVRVTFPGGNTQAYLDALKVALLVLVLSRPDLKLYDPSRYPLEIQKGIADGKILNPHEVFINCGLEKMAQLTDMVMSEYQKSIQTKGGNPKNFRSMLADSIERVAHNIYNTTGQNTQLEQIVVDQTQYLRTVTWGDIIDVHKTAPKLPLHVRKATLLQSIQSTTEAGRDPNVGLAMNPYCLDIPADRVDEWFYVNGTLQDRKPHMMEVSIGGKDSSMPGDETVAKANVPDFMASLNHGQQRFYERFIKPDGSIEVSPEFKPLLKSISNQVHTHGSADLSPVFFVNKVALNSLTSHVINYNPKEDGTLYYCRGLFSLVNNGQIFQEAATALSIAAAAIRRSSQDSAWIAVRAFDMFPGMEDFFAILTNWMKALQKSIKSIVDTIKRYIQFIEGRLVELQALIRRINALLQTLLGFAFQIPKCSFLTMISDGTQGVVGDLVNSKTKPNDSPLAYGAGIAVVIPFGPAIAMDLIQALITAQQGIPEMGQTLASLSDVVLVGIEGLPSPTPSGDVPPDVL